MIALKNIVKQTLGIFGLDLIRCHTYKDLRRAKSIGTKAIRDLEFLQAFNGDNSTKLIECLQKSRAQLRQDLFVLSQLNFQTNGFFVEFGATDGYKLSNTYLLEKYFEWHGILAEPARIWHRDLQNNRSCSLDYDCVWRNTGEYLSFFEASRPEISTISSYSATDVHAHARITGGQTYLVKTVSLNDLLKKHNAPDVIDYLSVDTEGSEYEILSGLDFQKYKFKIITCEHNYTSSRDQLYTLMTSVGYKRVFEELSYWDDWYVKA